jgi:hypothetical protein
MPSINKRSLRKFHSKMLSSVDGGRTHDALATLKDVDDMSVGTGTMIRLDHRKGYEPGNCEIIDRKIAEAITIMRLENTGVEYMPTAVRQYLAKHPFASV